MGKTADNERIKLRVAFYNNIAVGLMVAGFLLPLFAFWAKLHEFDFVSWWQSPADSIGKRQALGGGAAILFTFMLAMTFRSVANRQIGRLKD